MNPITLPTSRRALALGGLALTFLLLGVPTMLQAQTAAPATSAPAEDPDLLALLHRYVRGYYVRSAEDVLATLHPRVHKVGLGTSFLGQPVEHLAHLVHDQVAPLARFHNADGRLSPDAHNEAVLLHRTPDAALAAVYGADFMDYFHLVRMNRRWLIVNAVYGAPPEAAGRWPAEDERAVRAAVMRYADPRYEEGANGAAAVHPDYVRRRVEHRNGRDVLHEETSETLPFAGRRSPSGDAVRVLGVAGPIAAAVIDDPKGAEYIHLVRIDGRWRIVHALLTSAEF